MFPLARIVDPTPSLQHAPLRNTFILIENTFIVVAYQPTYTFIVYFKYDLGLAII